MVGGVASALGQADCWLGVLDMGWVNHPLCWVLFWLPLARIVCSSSIWVMLLSKNRLPLLRNRRSVRLICWRLAILRCLRCSCMVSMFWCLSGRSVNIVLLSCMGSLAWESMAYVLCFVILLTGDVILVCGLFLCFTWIQSLLSFSLKFGIPAPHQSLPEQSLSRSAYPPKSAANLWRGLNITSSSSQMDLNWYPLYLLFHMHLS